MKRRWSQEEDVFASVLDFSHEWNGIFPANLGYKPPRLLHSPSTFGPLFFNPSSDTLTPLLSSPSLSPLSDLTLAPRLSLPRFLTTSANPDSFIHPSLAYSIAGSFTPDGYGFDAESELRSNRLQLLHCPGEESAIVFFPVGENFDQVGFVKLVVKDGKLSALGAGDLDGVVPFVGEKKFVNKIVKIIVNPVDDWFGVGSDVVEVCIGNLMVFTMYSVHWFRVKLTRVGLEFEKPCLVYLGGKQFKSCCIADAVWSPHLPEESAVLLKNGEVFLFDLDSVPKNTSQNRSLEYKGHRFKALCKVQDVLEKQEWFGCEFCWHPRILIVGHKETVFVLDLRDEDEPSVTRLACIEVLDTRKSLGGTDMFTALARAGSDGFLFVVVSHYVLAIFDIRNPLMPVLQWHHNLDVPSYVEVHRLSDLRSGLREDSYDWASETGSCIILGSFWHNEFSVFCYGPREPAPKGSFVSKLSELSTSLYAWDLPSDILLTGQECMCESCLINNEFAKDALPKWVTWQQKKEIALGFGMISAKMSSLLSDSPENGGFTLVRLLSSGKLESERYCASWQFSNPSGKCHEAGLKLIGDNLLSSAGQENYKFPRRFKYIKLDYLNDYLNGDINNHLITNQNLGNRPKKKSRTTDSYKFIQEKLKASGLGVSKSITEVLEDVSFPSSIHEVAVRRMWTDLPMSLLQLAFSNYSELLEVRVDKKKVSLEFSPVPQEPQLPPFFDRKCSRRSNKWSNKVKRSDDIVGPLLPLPVLVSLQKASSETMIHGNRSDGISYESKFDYQIREVKQAAKELAVTISSNGTATALNNDTEKTPDCTRTSLFSSHKPFFMYTRGLAAHEHSTSSNSSEGQNKEDIHTTYISKKPHDSVEDTGDADQQQFTDLCPVELKFRGKMVTGKDGQHAVSLLKKQFSKWLGRFDAYQEFCRRPKYKKRC